MSSLIRKYKREAEAKVFAGEKPQPVWTFLNDRKCKNRAHFISELRKAGWTEQINEFGHVFMFPVDLNDEFRLAVWKAAHEKRFKTPDKNR